MSSSLTQGTIYAVVAQLGERYLGTIEVTDSISVFSTTFKNSELPEWPIGASWKGDGPARGTRVRISHSLPVKSHSA